MIRLEEFKSIYLRIIGLTLLLVELPGTVISSYGEIPPPAAAVFMIETGKNVTTVDFSKLIKGGSTPGSDYPNPHRILLNDIVNTDIEVAAGRKIELECMASNPVQWNYRGPGRPEFTTNVTVDILNNREVHKATLTIKNADAKDTGLYVCNYAEFPRIASTYHVFVAGPDIFVSDSGRTITYSSEMPTVTIPCPVSVKRAKVTLRKAYLDSLRIIEAPIAIYDPRFGFKLNVKDLRDAEGTYICSGYHQGSLRVREYTLRNEERNHTSVTFPQDLQDDINPCLAFTCPTGSLCRVNLNTNRPFCACRAKTGSPATTNCTRLCKSSHDCPKTEKCQFQVEKQLKMCLHVCEDHDCAENAECYVDEQRGIPKCRCRRGFQGNGNSRCERIPLKTDAELNGNSYCSSAACGRNANCQNIEGKVQCACYIGYFGKWPNCEKVCTQDTDCLLQDRCSLAKGVCEHACTDNPCAPMAECKVLHRKPVCRCRPGYSGNATEACYPSHYYYSSRSGLPADAESDFLEFETTTTTAGEFGNDEVTLQDDENEYLKLTLPDNEEEANSSTLPTTSMKLKR